MSDHARCPDCGAELPTGATAGLCPKCLLAGAMDLSDAAAGEASPFAPTTPQPGGFVPPSVESLGARFPQLEIVGLLGHGGMGAVYKARQTKLDRFVALKIIRPESADDPAFAERFTREARTLARLSHPQIVAVHDFGELRGEERPGEAAALEGPARLAGPARTLYYFVMEYVDGANLRELMQSGRLRPEEALAIVPQICDALQYAHDEGVVHRDIKPENILIDRRGRVKIADFGLAKLAAQAPENFTLTGTHQVMGTPRYMAPEQMAGSRAVDHRADIYSLGVVFYEMLTGELPLGSFEPPSSRTAVDPRLDQVVLRALAREPERRYQRASEVRTDVESIVRGEAGAPLQWSRDVGRARHSGESGGEVWNVAGLVARGWLFYMILSFCVGAFLIGGATILNWLGERFPESMPAGTPLDMAPVKLFVLGAGIAAVSLAVLIGLFRQTRRWWAGRRGAAVERSVRMGAPSAINVADRRISSASLPFWSAEQHGSISGPGASTVLERGLAGLVNQFRPAPSATTSPQALETSAPRFSRKAILGACWAPLFLLTALMFVPASISIANVPGPETPRVLLAIPALLIGLPGVLAPFGTTILGLVAISEIRHSRGRLTGLGLAFVDAVLFPLLLMNGAMFAMIFIPLLPSNVGWQGAMGFGLAGMALIGGSLTVFLARSGWRAASAASHHSDIAAPATEGSSFGKRLSPDSLPSGESNRGPVSPVTPAEFSPGTETAPPPPPFPDLDVRRIQMELKGPAGGLLIVAALSAIYWCVLAFLLVWEAWGLQSGGFTGDPVDIILAILGGSVVLLIVAALLAGARHMRRMTGYGWAYAASILAMLPWSLAVVVGLPVGIWAFRLLRRQDVRDAFLAQAIERERARPLVRRGGRDWVTLTREQAEDDDLPDVCIVCGAPTRERLSKNFEYTPDWAGILCLFGLFPGLIAIALTQKSMRMACPVCPSDRGHWSRLVWVSSTGWVFTVPLAGIGYLIAELLGGRNEALLAGALVGAGIGLVLWLVPVIYLSSTRVSAKSISDGRITLQRVSPAFAKAVTARRMRRSGPESASVLRV